MGLWNNKMGLNGALGPLSGVGTPTWGCGTPKLGLGPPNCAVGPLNGALGPPSGAAGPPRVGLSGRGAPAERWMCIGEPPAQTQLFIFTTALLQRFR